MLGCLFVTYDYVNRNPGLVQRMIDEGHVSWQPLVGRILPYQTVSIDEARMKL